MTVSDLAYYYTLELMLWGTAFYFVGLFVYETIKKDK
tara:strand:+ start:251 stop:361 length:111 start_codon:yes stop_codon:yes gene_type:complete